MVNSLNGVAWFRLPNATDLWQPVDAGYAQVLKSFISIEHREWLEFDNYADRWFCNEKHFSAKERRILISNWEGNDWEKLSSLNMTNWDVNVGLKQAAWFLIMGAKINSLNQRTLKLWCTTSELFESVINNPVPDEQHRENNVSDAALFNEDTELV